jgi:hypothetical protein
LSRHHCTVNLLKGYALDSGEWPAEVDSVCKRCQGCDSAFGEQGIAGDGILLRMDDAGQRVVLSWECPGCGSGIVEGTTPLSSLTDALQIKDDPLCWRCRKVQEITGNPAPDGIRQW